VHVGKICTGVHHPLPAQPKHYFGHVTLQCAVCMKVAMYDRRILERNGIRRHVGRRFGVGIKLLRKSTPADKQDSQEKQIFHDNKKSRQDGVTQENRTKTWFPPSHRLPGIALNNGVVNA
jgi:hypothetical protein